MALLNDLLGIGTAWSEKGGFTFFDMPTKPKKQDVKITVEVKSDNTQDYDPFEVPEWIEEKARKQRDGEY